MLGRKGERLRDYLKIIALETVLNLFAVGRSNEKEVNKNVKIFGKVGS